MSDGIHIREPKAPHSQAGVCSASHDRDLVATSYVSSKFVKTSGLSLVICHCVRLAVPPACLARIVEFSTATTRSLHRLPAREKRLRITERLVPSFTSSTLHRQSYQINPSILRLPIYLLKPIYFTAPSPQQYSQPPLSPNSSSPRAMRTKWAHHVQRLPAAATYSRGPHNPSPPL
jgi:hypothetical protein